MHPPPAPLEPKYVWQECWRQPKEVQRNTVLNRNRRLLLWWSQEKKDVNDVNLPYDNSQSGHGPQGWGGMAGLPPCIVHWVQACTYATPAEVMTRDFRKLV